MDPREQHLVYLRWALIASLAYMILLAGDEAPRWMDLAYVGLLLASNLLIPRLPYRNPRTFGTVLLTLDTIFVLAGLLLCRSTSQDLLVSYFLCIVMASFADSDQRIAAGASLVTGVYSFWIFQNWDALRASLLMRLPFLFVTTVFYGYMMQRVRTEHQARVRTEAQVRGLDTLLEVTRSFSSSLASRDVLERVAATIRNALGVEDCRIVLVSDASTEREAAEALEHRRPVVRSGGEPPSTAVLAVPIIYDVEALAVLVVRAEREGGFRTDEVEFCQVIANAAASGLKNARQYETLVMMEKAKSEFLSNLSHELRTPLGAIVGYAELAGDHATERQDAVMSQFVGNIMRSANEMTGHVEALLRLSQATLGREAKRVGRVDLRAMLDRALESARRMSIRREIDFRSDVEPDIGEIYADGEKLSRIVEHMLLNAVKFTERGSIQLAAVIVRNDAPANLLPNGLHPWERLLSLSIRDTGIGVDGADLERIFSEFQQVDGSATRKFNGLGIGLSVCRRLANVLGGVIRVDSRPGEGSVFEVLVPVELPR